MLCARIRRYLDQAVGANPWLVPDAEAAVRELSRALGSGSSDFDAGPWRRFFQSVRTITQRLDAMRISPHQKLAAAHLARLVDENRDLIDE
jgi:hypothetical protein